MKPDHETLRFALQLAAEARCRYEHDADQPLDKATPAEYLKQALDDTMRALVVSKQSFSAVNSSS